MSQAPLEAGRKQKALLEEKKDPVEEAPAKKPPSWKTPCRIQLRMQLRMPLRMQLRMQLRIQLRIRRSKATHLQRRMQRPMEACRRKRCAWVQEARSWRTPMKLEGVE